MSTCQSLHDWVSQEDPTGYEWAECAQCGAISKGDDEDE
jgi:hypothetical protein